MRKLFPALFSVFISSCHKIVISINNFNYLSVIPSELEDQILDAEASGNKLRVDALLLGAIKTLKSNKAKPDAILYINLLYLAKDKPELFLSNRVVEVSL